MTLKQSSQHYHSLFFGKRPAVEQTKHSRPTNQSSFIEGTSA